MSAPIIAGISFTVLCLVGFWLYGIVIVRFVKRYKQKFSKHVFYIYVVLLGVGDLLILSGNAFLAIFNVFAQRRLFPDWYEHVVCAVQTGGFGLIGMASFLIACNRLCAVVTPLNRLNKFLFCRERIWWSVIVAFSFGAWGYVSPTFIAECPMKFSPWKYQFYFDCYSKNATERHSLFQSSEARFDYVLKSFVLIVGMSGLVILLFYATIFAYLAYSRKQNLALNDDQQKQRQATERRLMYQGGLIGLTLFLSNQAFVHLSDWSFPTGAIIVYCITMSNSVLSPIIYLVFNKDFKANVSALNTVAPTGQQAKSKQRQ